jgi:hypothetical protein
MSADYSYVESKISRYFKLFLRLLARGVVSPGAKWRRYVYRDPYRYLDFKLQTPSYSYYLDSLLGIPQGNASKLTTVHNSAHFL